MSDRKPETLVIGGGIGGLTLAILVHKHGIPCRILGAAPGFRPLGVGIYMMLHAIRVLTSLDMQPTPKNQ